MSEPAGQRTRGRPREDGVPHGTETSVAAGRDACPECGGGLVNDEERAETTCGSCGLVVGTDRIDRGPEWRAFDENERRERSRVGAPTTQLRHDRGLSAEIGSSDRDGYGRTLSSNQRQRMNRLRSLDRRYRIRDSSDRNLRHALGEIDRMGCALGLPENVRETAAMVYRRALGADLVAGRSIEAVATACLYAAARQAGTPRSTAELATVSRVEELSFVRAYRNVVRELGLEVDLADPATYLRRFASEVGVSRATERRARELLRDGQEAGVHVGKSPTGLAAAAIYAGCLLADGTATQAEIAEVADVCEVTIRNRYQELLAVADGE